MSFSVPAGRTFGLVGESGCGKTTIGRLIVGLEKVTSGQILFGGEDLSRFSGRERRRLGRKIQLMFQDSYASMDPRMRVGAILREPLVIQRQGGRASQQQRVAAILDEVGLPAAAADRYPHEFSGGQRQRLGLARALILRPAVIVADEPVSALDVSIQAQILNLMRDLQASHGLSYVFISRSGAAPAAPAPTGAGARTRRPRLSPGASLTSARAFCMACGRTLAAPAAPTTPRLPPTNRRRDIAVTAHPHSSDPPYVLSPNDRLPILSSPHKRAVIGPGKARCHHVEQSRGARGPARPSDARCPRGSVTFDGNSGRPGPPGV